MTVQLGGEVRGLLHHQEKCKQGEGGQEGGEKKKDICSVQTLPLAGLARDSQGGRATVPGSLNCHLWTRDRGSSTSPLSRHWSLNFNWVMHEVTCAQAGKGLCSPGWGVHSTYKANRAAQR